MTKTKGYIFDFDGTLANTQDILQQSLISILHELHPAETHVLDLKETAVWWPGKSNDVIFGLVEKRYGIKLPPDILARLIKRTKEDLAVCTLVPSDPHLMPLLKTLSRKFGLAVGSNGEQDVVRSNIRKIEAHPFFVNRRIVTITDTPGRGKPNPDIFNLAAKRMGLDPRDCTVVGDKNLDFLGSQNAGMNFIGYVGCDTDPDKAAHEFRELGAKHLISSYADFPLL